MVKRTDACCSCVQTDCRLHDWRQIRDTQCIVDSSEKNVKKSRITLKYDRIFLKGLNISIIV